MKILFVMHGINHKTIKTAYQKKLGFAAQFGCDVDTCVYGSREEIEECGWQQLCGKVYLLETETYLPQVVEEPLRELVVDKGYTSVVIADGGCAGELAVQLADALSRKCITAVVEIEKENKGILCKKMIYNNLAAAQYQLPEEFVISERLVAETHSVVTEEPLEVVKLNSGKIPPYILEQKLHTKRREQAVSPILIAAGMGIQSREEITQLREYARKHGFSFGVSRPVAMRGWADIDEIVGVSGTIYAPEIAIVIGVSGAAAFMAGIEQSKYILSINVNPDANIAKQSDAMIVDSYQNVLPLLLERLV